MSDRWVRAMRTDSREERGAALVIVLLFMVISIILITAVLAVTGNEIRISGLHRDSVRALELAHAGLQEGVQRIQGGHPFFISGQGTTQCPDGFPPSVPLASGERLKVGVCPRLLGFGITVYEVQADATVGVAVRRLSLAVRVVVNNVPPEIVLSRDFGQQGSAAVGRGNVHTETFSQYDQVPPSPQLSFAGYFIQDLGLAGDPKCYRWPCTFGTNLFPGHRRLKYLSDPLLSDLTANVNETTCTTSAATIPAGGIRADDPTQTPGTGTYPRYGFDTDPAYVTYVLREAPSDLPIGGVGANQFSKALTTGAGAATPQTVSVPGNSDTLESFAFTASGDPGTNGRGGDYAVVVNLTGGHASVKLKVRAERVNGITGVTYPGTGPGGLAVSAWSAEQDASAGIKIFSLYDVTTLGSWLAGDRLKIVYHFRNTGNPARDITFEFGTNNETVSVPFGTENAKTSDHPCGLPYKYVSQAFTDETGASVTRYFKTVALEHWFPTYYVFTPSCPGDPNACGWNPNTALQNNPHAWAIPQFPSGAYMQSLINQAPPGNTRTGGGTLGSGSGINWGCPPVGLPDPHTPGCNGQDGNYQFIALVNGNYNVNSNVNGYGTIVVTGDLTINGTFTWRGTIYVKGGVTLGAGNVTVTGGMVTEQTTIMSGNITINTGQDAGDITVSNEVTITVGAMWER